MPQPFAQFGEKVVVQNGGDFHQRFGVNPTAGIDEIHVVAVAVQLFRQPHGAPALFLHFGLDEFSSMYLFVFHYSNSPMCKKKAQKNRELCLLSPRS